MKRFIQISLVIVLLFVLFQYAAIGSVVSAGGVAVSAATSLSTAADSPAENGEMAVPCLVWREGVICVRPNVGWNS